MGKPYYLHFTGGGTRVKGNKVAWLKLHNKELERGTIWTQVLVLKPLLLPLFCNKIRKNYCLLLFCHCSLIVISLDQRSSFRYMRVYNEKERKEVEEERERYIDNVQMIYRLDR